MPLVDLLMLSDISEGWKDRVRGQKTDACQGKLGSNATWHWERACLSQMSFGRRDMLNTPPEEVHKAI